jgi:hypothetical protein
MDFIPAGEEKNVGLKMAGFGKNSLSISVELHRSIGIMQHWPLRMFPSCASVLVYNL